MKQYDLKFCFKGSRNYVQGPDIFDKVLEKLKNDFELKKLKKIKYAAHTMLYNNAKLFVTNSFRKKDFNIINSIVTFNLKNEKFYAVVCETEEKISCKVDYSEEIVRNHSKINDKIITFENILDDSLTEIIVSMNKFYLQEAVTKSGKWIVTQFEYNDLINYFDIKNKVLKLELLSNFNNKLTKSKVFLDNNLVGYLYFSLV